MLFGSLSVEEWNKLLADSNIRHDGLKGAAAERIGESIEDAHRSDAVLRRSRVPGEQAPSPGGWTERSQSEDESYPKNQSDSRKEGNGQSNSGHIQSAPQLSSAKSGSQLVNQIAKEIRFGSLKREQNNQAASEQAIEGKGSTSSNASSPANAVPSPQSLTTKRSWANVASSGLPANKEVVGNGDTLPDKSSPTPNGALLPYDDLTKMVKNPYSLEERMMELFDLALTEDVPHFPPRGIHNGGNRCFINVVLQALLACFPFRQFLFSLADENLEEKMPLLDRFIFLAKELYKEEPENGNTLEAVRPDFVFSSNASSLNATERIGVDSFVALISGGSQEDAQEFLVHALAELHEETLPPESEKAAPAPVEDDEGWEEVGRGGRSVITQKNEYIPSCISCIFGGLLRSELKRSNKKPSVTREPFMCLQLDIENSHVQRLDDALRLYFEPESLEDYTLESSKETVEAKKHSTLDRLPRVLILNLKRFSYNPEAGEGSKIMKKIEYPEELRMHLNFLSSNQIAPTKDQRLYKLTAVVTHHGKEVAGGHYTCDVGIRKDGNTLDWVHCDDSNVYTVSKAVVLTRQAYLLFYTLAADCR